MESQERLQTLVDYWRNRMNLPQWKIDGELSSEIETGAHADILIDHDFHRARLRVDASGLEADWKWLVVHELVHLVFNPMNVGLEGIFIVMEAASKIPMRDLVPFTVRIEEPIVQQVCEAIIGERMPR